MKSFALPPIRNLKTDLPASLSLVIVAIPLCLGIAHASGAPIMAGLIAGVVGGLIVGFFSESNLSVSGPAAGLTTICLTSIASLGSYQGLVTALLLAGLIQIAFGYLRMGFFSNYIPTAVIKGMLSAIGLMLILKQFPHLVGYDSEELGAEDFSIDNEEIVANVLPKEHENTLSHLLHAFNYLNYAVMAIGIVSLMVLVIWELKFSKKYKMIPGSLVAVLGGTLVSLAINYFIEVNPINEEHYVNLPNLFGGEVHESLITFPAIGFVVHPGFWKVVFTLAIVASLESLLSIEAIEKLDPHKQRIDGNKELIAQGAGNMISAAIGGLPVTSVIVRGSVNIAAGAQSKWSAMLHGFFILLAILFLSKIINQIPLAALAAVLCYTGFKLIHPENFKEQFARGWYQFIPFVVTIFAIVFSDLLIGVLIGLFVSSFFIVRENYQSPVLKVDDLGLRVRIRLGNNISFLHKYQIIKVLENIEPNVVIEIDGSELQFIDPDILDVLAEFKSRCKEKNIELIIGGIRNMDTKDEINEQIEKSYKKLFENNRNWVEKRIKADPEYFQKLTNGQKPEYLFIGCSDSRVPANEITGTDPGEMFVHRNIANMVVNTDINMLSVLQYSVEVLNVKHVIVCGHYGCGGVKAALGENPLGLIDKWLRNIKDVYRLHQDEIEAIKDPEEQHRRMVEVNVKEQVFNLMKTSYVQKNRELYGFPQVHGWVYDISEGYIRDLEVDVDKDLMDHSIYKLK
ncbi:MAG: sulfate permease [Bacteroidetes bacterium B1(2017)]|nr:MAG: sulfate permease [Bacteroidetes bacterium B1(2017)]